MLRECEICANLSAATRALVTSRERGLSRVDVGDREIALCVEHAAEVREFGIARLAQLRQRVLEPFPGRRSLLNRRSVESVKDRAFFGRRESDLPR